VRHRPVLRSAVVGAALLLSLTAAACGGDDDEPATDATTTTAAADDGSTTTEAEEPADDEGGGSLDGSEGSTTTTGDDADDTTTTEADDGGATGSDLASVLLTPEDLPEGFTQDGEDDTEVDEDEFDEPLCEGGEGPGIVATEQISRELADAEFTSLVASDASRYADDEAEQLFALITSEYDRCGGQLDEGESYEVQELPGVGDEALVVTFTSADAPDGTFDLAVARVGDVIVAVSAFTDGSTELDVPALLAITADRV
jgi:hypothetical protein